MKMNDGVKKPALIADEIAQPAPRDGELLIRVHAAGVTPTELIWYPTTHKKDGRVRTGAVPGHEFSGVVAGVGDGAAGFKVGDEVYGMNDWFADGATAEFCVTQPQNIALKPKSLTHELAATVPISALTAWQGLLERAKMKRGERILIHGAAGAVGLFAVQLAHLNGAHVIATVSSADREFVKQLGADEVIDYKTSRFEDCVKNVDIVFDAVGGETLDRSWQVLRTGGRVVTIAANSESRSDERSKNAFFIVEPNQKQLIEVATMLDAGVLKPFLAAAVPFDRASAAYEKGLASRLENGKVIIVVAA